MNNISLTTSAPRWCSGCGSSCSCGGCSGWSRGGGGGIRAQTRDVDDGTEWAPTRLSAAAVHTAHHQAASGQVLVAEGTVSSRIHSSLLAVLSPELESSGPAQLLVEPIVTILSAVTLQALVDALPIEATQVTIGAAVLVPGIWTLWLGSP